jgi:hypothetical protein
MNVRLQIFKQDDVNDYSLGRRFRFAIVDLDKSENYPSNFVCMLPAQISREGKPHSIFLQVFGDKSLEQAKALLTEALKTEDDSEVKAEIERRLKLLEPKPASQIECSACGKLFQPRRVRRFKQNFCPECMKKKYGTRE